ncbi:MAG: hypothetical protein R3B84_07720 [Zavarzinella sp.]
MRNRAVGRTFIEGANRADRVRLKYTPLEDVLRGKKVLLVEDSIVRSTTLKELLGHIRERGGAKEIHVRVACPPIIATCYYGIDMSTMMQLFAPKFLGKNLLEGDFDERFNRFRVALQRYLTLGYLDPQIEVEMARQLEADSLRYLPINAIADAIDISGDHLCQACINSEYPTETGRLLQLGSTKRWLEGVADNGRDYQTT